jgi:hypothetical protein
MSIEKDVERDIVEFLARTWPEPDDHRRTH